MPLFNIAGRQSRTYQLAWPLRMITLSVCIYELPVTTLLANIERRYEGALILFYFIRWLNGSCCCALMY